MPRLAYSCRKLIGPEPAIHIASEPDSASVGHDFRKVLDMSNGFLDRCPSLVHRQKARAQVETDYSPTSSYFPGDFVGQMPLVLSVHQPA